MSLLPDWHHTGALLSDDKNYRYILWRSFVYAPVNPCLFVMLNPSSATAETDDPTVRKCQVFASRWGHDECRVVNIFAWRSTDPRVLPHLPNPVGDENNSYLLVEFEKAARIVCAWGAHGKVLNRGKAVRELLAPYAGKTWCFGRNKDGEPTHPLYMPYERELERFNARKEAR